MSSKHVFNSSDGLVLSSLRGAVALNPALRLHKASKSIFIASPSAKVAVIAGGGAGHEPAHASYTGKGMLSASVSGDIFASPSSSQILTAIQLAVAKSSYAEPSVLLIVNNYTGDRLNFGLAAEKARSLGVEIETVVVADDVSLLDKNTLVGARGLGGNILVCKIIGAAAERGDNIKELKLLGESVADNLASIGVGLEHCHVPGRSRPSNEKCMADGEYEVGMGLHNEPGAKKVILENGPDIVTEMMQQILSSNKKKGKIDEDFVHSDGQSLDQVVLFVNNLGGMSQLEMGAVLDQILTHLEVLDIYPVRIYLSSFMTSLNAPGFSVSLLNLSSVHSKIRKSITKYDPTDILSLLDAPTDALAWIGTRTCWPSLGQKRDRCGDEKETDKLVEALNEGVEMESDDFETASINEWQELGYRSGEILEAIMDACAAVFAAEDRLTEYDTILGDGDCGETFASGAKALLLAINTEEIEIAKLSGAGLAAQIASILESSMGGTSGALFGLFFAALSNALRPSSSNSSSASLWKNAPLQALEALSTYTPAQPGDRTVMDALYPFCSALSSGEILTTAAAAARKGAELTCRMRPRLGRAVYVGAVDEEKSLPPDPGAFGVAVIVTAMAKSLANTS